MSPININKFSMSSNEGLYPLAGHSSKLKQKRKTKGKERHVKKIKKQFHDAIGLLFNTH